MISQRTIKQSCLEKCQEKLRLKVASFETIMQDTMSMMAGSSLSHLRATTSTSPPPQLITFTGTVVIFHTFVMISGVSRSLPPTNRMPHGVWWPSRSNVTASALNLCILSWTAEPRLVNELLCKLIGRWTARVGIKSLLSAYQLKTPLSKTLYSASATQNSS